MSKTKKTVALKRNNMNNRNNENNSIDSKDICTYLQYVYT